MDSSALLADVNPVLVLGAAAAVVLLLMLVMGRRPQDAPPVVSFGAPVVGNFQAFASRPVEMIREGYDRMGSVFTMQMFGKNLTFLIGPDVVEPFFNGKDDEMSQNEVYSFMTPVFGKNIVYDAPPKYRTQQLKHTAEALRSRKLVAYVPKIVRETEAFIRGWGEEGQIDLLEALSELTILTSSRCLHGDDVREGLFAEVAALYHDLDKGITPISFFWPNAPIPAHWARNNARKEMVRIFSKVIAARREKQDTSDHTDILQVFIDMRYKDGGQLSDDEVTGMLIALLFAGQHTSSITSTWTAAFLMANPQFMEKVRAEQDNVRGGHDELDHDQVMHMDYLHDCIREGLRLHPPLIMLMRMAKKNIPIRDKDGKVRSVIPKGDLCFTSPAVHMRLPSVFSNPDTYDPDRFFERKEDATKFSFMGFGAGMHQCLGQQFGMLQVKTLLSTLFQHYDFELLSDFPKPDYTAMVVGPKGPLQVRYRKRPGSTL